MCGISKKLIFCSCRSENDIIEQIGQFQWTLDRFVGLKETRLKGKILRPSDLDNDINIKNVICEMNERNCFDFDYLPKERDCFKINNGHLHPNYKYFSLIYKNGKWEEGSNPAFGATISENIAVGKVKSINKKL